MPAGSPIGSGQGVLNPLNISLCLETLKEGDPNYPVIVDAGVGTASDVAIAMELGADGVLLNTGIAHAKDPVKMADAMRLRTGSRPARLPSRANSQKALRHRQQPVRRRHQLHSRRMNAAKLHVPHFSSELWHTLAQKAGLTLNSVQTGQLGSYLDLLFAANQRMNLTRITNRGDAEVLHVGDALTLLPHLPPQARRLADVGCGGRGSGHRSGYRPAGDSRHPDRIDAQKSGFPSRHRRRAEISQHCRRARRAEEVAHTSQRESFDIVVARAVALLPILVEWLLPLVKVGGLRAGDERPKIGR